MLGGLCSAKWSRGGGGGVSWLKSVITQPDVRKSCLESLKAASPPFDFGLGKGFQLANARRPTLGRLCAFPFAFTPHRHGTHPHTPELTERL